MIKVYSTQTCPYCVTLKNFLKEKGFEFEDIDAADKKKFRIKEGVKIKTLSNPDYTEYANLLNGAIILSIDGQKAKDMETVSSYLAKKENQKAQYQIITKNGQMYSIIM